MFVYADNAATTKMSRVAIDAMLPYYDDIYANPSSLHTAGQRAKEVLEDARARVAKCLNCEAKEILFTSGGSEADNQAIVSAARYGARKGKNHIVSTAFLSLVTWNFLFSPFQLFKFYPIFKGLAQIPCSLYKVFLDFLCQDLGLLS